MSKPNPNVRYFVAKFQKEMRGGSRNRIIRRTKGKKTFFGRAYVEHVYDRGAWKSTRQKFWQVSNLLPTRAAARAEKLKADGKR